MVVLGHVDAGKSTLMGRTLHAMGAVSQKAAHKNERDAKAAGKASFAWAWALDERPEERARGVTVGGRVAPGCKVDGQLGADRAQTRLQLSRRQYAQISISIPSFAISTPARSTRCSSSESFTSTGFVPFMWM